MSSSVASPDRAGWEAVFVASLLGLVVALGVFALGVAANYAGGVGDWTGWLTLVAMPFGGGVVAGARLPRDRSSAVGSALLVAVWLGVIAFHLGLLAHVDGPIDPPPGTWLRLSIVWTPFALVLAGAGGLVGATTAAIWHDRGTPAGASGEPIGLGDEIRLHRIGRATVEGVGVMLVVAAAGVFVGPLAVLLGAPFSGGFVAGGRSPGGAAIGVFTGLLAGFVYVVALVALFVLWLRSLTWVGYGIGFVIVFFVLALLLAIVLSALGGLLGGLASSGSGDDGEDSGATEPATES